MPDKTRPILTYKGSGVDIEAGEAFVNRIRPRIARTQGPEVLGGLGGFGGLFQLNPGEYQHPILVATTDGVGTKLRLALERDRHQGVGIDLVAMCVNDLIVCGARPLFFLDYLATGQLQLDRSEAILEGIAQGCETASCALLGGETAEMPGFYAGEDYDLAGFAVGLVERESLIDGSRAQAGAGLIGLPSSGVHSNGFSLVREILASSRPSWDMPIGEVSLEETLLEPTRIYAAAVQILIRSVDVQALAHISGGGILGNLPRCLPPGLGAHLDRRAWPRPPIFSWLEEEGNVDPGEMLRTFNEGLGMIAVVPDEETENALEALAAEGEAAYRIGHLVADPKERIWVDG